MVRILFQYLSRTNIAYEAFEAEEEDVKIDDEDTNAQEFDGNSISLNI